ncbi:helix-turn-helix domain-containing protein [Gluconobacter japonicus]|uniref:helix-turn-helix domain-containing protein n=1 Tax=Gluconobacter japonicus TaxID=376620 RepID=UPI0039ED0C76
MSNLTASRLAKLRKDKSSREGRRFSAQEVADAVGISRSTLSGYERGHDQPGIANLVALATYYGVSVDFLMGTTASVESPDDFAHNEEERLLLRIWRRLNDDQRGSWMGLLQSMVHDDAA